VSKSDPPNPAQIAAYTRALVQSGELTVDAAIDGLNVIVQELRNAYGASGDALKPIEGLIGKLRSGNRRASSAGDQRPSSE
jgi:hypothetical protein